MAFKPLRKKRKRGEKFPEGFIKRKIVLIASIIFPKGLPEPQLREFIREEWGISETKGIKLHLSDLEEKKVLIKEEKKGFANVWKLDKKYETFKSLVEMFHNSEDETEFARSKYTQSIINEDFVDHFAVGWGREYIRSSSKPNPETTYGKPLDAFQPQELMETFYFHLLGLKKEELIQLLRISPSSLHNFLFPEKLSIELIPLSTYFLIPFVQDIVIYGVPEGKGLETKLEVKYGDMKRVKGEMKVVPSINAKAQIEYVSGKVAGEE